MGKKYANVYTYRQSLGESDEDGTLLKGRGCAGHSPHESVVEAGAVREHHRGVAPVANVHIQGVSENKLHL